LVWLCLTFDLTRGLCWFGSVSARFRFGSCSAISNPACAIPFHPSIPSQRRRFGFIWLRFGGDFWFSQRRFRLHLASVSVATPALGGVDLGLRSVEVPISSRLQSPPVSLPMHAYHIQAQSSRATPSRPIPAVPFRSIRFVPFCSVPTHGGFVGYGYGSFSISLVVSTWVWFGFGSVSVRFLFCHLPIPRVVCCSSHPSRPSGTGSASFGSGFVVTPAFGSVPILSYPNPVRRVPFRPIHPKPAALVSASVGRISLASASISVRFWLRSRSWSHLWLSASAPAAARLQC